MSAMSSTSESRVKIFSTHKKLDLISAKRNKLTLAYRTSQARDHRRWCSHAEIELPAGVPPASGPPELAGSSAVLASPSSGSSGSAAPSSGDPIPSYNNNQPRGGRSQRIGIDNLSAPSTNSVSSFNSINSIIRYI